MKSKQPILILLLLVLASGLAWVNWPEGNPPVAAALSIPKIVSGAPNPLAVELPTAAPAPAAPKVSTPAAIAPAAKPPAPGDQLAWLRAEIATRKTSTEKELRDSAFVKAQAQERSAAVSNGWFGQAKAEDITDLGKLDFINGEPRELVFADGSILTITATTNPDGSLQLNVAPGGADQRNGGILLTNAASGHSVSMQDPRYLWRTADNPDPSKHVIQLTPHVD